MSVTRDKLYEEVWAEPMAKVAVRYRISANYLARVCHHLNVPFPHRGYWAKRLAGKAPGRPSLSPPRPGEVLEWERGDAVPRVAQKPETASREPMRVGAPSVSARPVRHHLVVGARESFEKARLSEIGYLRPFKRNLVDLFVTRETLSYALETANELFLRIEAHGHRVTLATDGALRRPELHVFEGQKFDYYNREPWRPGRETIAYIGDVAFGLTLYELTEYVDVTYRWDRPIRYARASPTPAGRRPRWAADSTVKQHMPCGRLCLRAYSPYGRVAWEKSWTETKADELARQFSTIVKELEAEAPTLSGRCEEARKQAEIERQRWEEERRERERRERERRRVEAVKASREQLLAIVDDWSLARRIESFFEDARRSAARLHANEATLLLSKLDRARQLLGGIDSLGHFATWETPEDRVPDTDGDDDDLDDDDDALA